MGDADFRFFLRHDPACAVLEHSAILRVHLTTKRLLDNLLWLPCCCTVLNKAGGGRIDELRWRLEDSLRWWLQGHWLLEMLLWLVGHLLLRHGVL